MTWSDEKKAKVEIDIISNVLSKLKDEYYKLSNEI